MESYAFEVIVLPMCEAVVTGLLCGTCLLRVLVGFDQLLGSSWDDGDAASSPRQDS